MAHDHVRPIPREPDATRTTLGGGSLGDVASVTTMTFSWQAYPAILRDLFVILVLAPVIGSFLGVLIRRLPRGLAVVRARSCCESCGARLGPSEMVPLVSYALQHGRCRHCAAAIGRFHPAIELAAMILAGWAATAGNGMPLILDCILGWPLLALAIIDWRDGRLPDALTLPLILLGLGMTWWLEPERILDHALAAALGYLGFQGFAWLYRRLRGREGLGQGDAKLLAGSGAWLGLVPLPNVILIAAVIGLVIAGFLWWRQRRLSAETALPFGPCLALATWLVWLYA